MSIVPEKDFCAAASAAAGESIVATATAQIDLWLVLEYGGTWAAKAWESAQLPLALRQQLDEVVGTDGRARIQLVRRDHALSTDGPSLTLALAGGVHPSGKAVRFVCESYEQMAGLDIPGAVRALRAGLDVPDAALVHKPIALVCTNGKRDRCCAKWGPAVVGALARKPEIEVWHTTHLGGHRFAGTLVWLPDGLCFGRVTPDDADAMVEGILSRQIWALSHFRGRCALSAPAMAAEHFLREARALMGIDDVRVLAVIQAADHRYRVAVSCRGTAGDPVYVDVHAEQTGLRLAPSCGKAPEAVLKWHAVLGAG